MDEDPINPLLGHSINYRIAVGAQAGRMVYTLQILSAGDPEENFEDMVFKVARFSLRAGVAAKAHEREYLERLCRYIARKVRYDLKAPCN